MGNMSIINSKNSILTGVLLILLIFFWSTVASVFKLVLNEISYLNMLFYSSFFSTCSIFIYIMMRKRIHLMRISRKEMLKASLIGMMSPFLYYNILFKAYELLPAQEAQPLNYTWPIVLAVFAVIFLKEKITLYTIIGIIIAFFGVLFITTKGHPLSFRSSDILGDILALGSSLIWAFYWIVAVKRKDNYDVKMFFCFLFGTFYIFLEIILLGKLEFINMRNIMLSAYIGAFEMGITFLLWINILSRVTNRSSIILVTYIIPFISLFFIQIIVKEPIQVYSIVGLSFIVTGIITDYIGKNIIKKKEDKWKSA